MATNAAQFNRELKNEMNAAGPENFVAFRADLCADMVSIAASRSRIGRTKRLVRSHGGATGSPKNWIRSSGPLRAHLRKTKVGTKVFVGSDDFKASWHEHGTDKMSARPMWRPALESVKDRRR